MVNLKNKNIKKNFNYRICFGTFSSVLTHLQSKCHYKNLKVSMRPCINWGDKQRNGTERCSDGCSDSFPHPAGLCQPDWSQRSCWGDPSLVVFVWTRHSQFPESLCESGQTSALLQQALCVRVIESERKMKLRVYTAENKRNDARSVVTAGLTGRQMKRARCRWRRICNLFRVWLN